MSQAAACDALFADLAARQVAPPTVLAAMAKVPREMFVPDTFRDHCYDDTALPIGQGQTISQPTVVAMMTAALDVGDRMKVLEIGTGSGYQTAILSYLARRVYTIERHAALLKVAEARLETLRRRNFTTMLGDGGRGWPEQAPFERILVTAAAEDAPPPALLDQLAVGGILILPVAYSAVDQRLLRIQRTETGLEQTDLGGVRFVPLVSDQPEGPVSVAKALRRLRQRGQNG